jgi:hypothetical protein
LGMERARRGVGQGSSTGSSTPRGMTPSLLAYAAAPASATPVGPPFAALAFDKG